MLILGAAVLFILIAVNAGLYFWGKKRKKISKKTASNVLSASAVMVLLSVFLVSVGTVVLTINKAHAVEPAAAVETVKAPAPVQGVNGLGLVAAGIAVGVGCIGGGIAVGMSAAAAIGAISENPKMFGNAIVFVGLAEGVAIYGVVIAIMILNKL